MQRFEPYATGQRCLEAVETPFIFVNGLSRHLSSVSPNLDDCYRTCSFQGYTMPFYFNLYQSATTVMCYWCVVVADSRGLRK